MLLNNTWSSRKLFNMHAYEVSSPVSEFGNYKEKCYYNMWSSRKQHIMHAYQVSLSNLRRRSNMPEAVYYSTWSSWKRCTTHAYQVPSPCVLPSTSLRSEDVI